MRSSILTLVAWMALAGCGAGGDQKEEGEGSAFEQMVILEEDPSDIDISSDRKVEFNVR